MIVFRFVPIKRSVVRRFWFALRVAGALEEPAHVRDNPETLSPRENERYELRLRKSLSTCGASQSRE
jgi:hypothetical protein